MKKKKAKRAKHMKVKRKVVKKPRKKVIFFVIDGMADLPINGKTPLSVARKPNLDYLAANGMTGELKLVPEKLEVASQVANVSLLGFNPENYHLQRGPLEAIGADQPYKEGHLALRCNFATVDKDLVVLDRRAGRTSFGLNDIARYINEHVNIGAPFVIRNTFGHRAVLVIKEKLSDKINGNDPRVVGERVGQVEALTPEAEKPARLVQDFIDKSREIIEFHAANEQRMRNGIMPANYILVRDAGNQLPKLPSFTKRHKLVKAVCIAENGVMKATCLLAGFNSVTVPELKFESTLKFIFDAIDTAIPEYDFIYVHIKGPDEPAHDGDFHRKQMMIERIDKELESFRDFKGIVVVTCDHITSCKLRGHAHGSVPFVVHGKGKDRIDKFDEFAVKKGRMGMMTGKQLINFVLR